MLNFKPLGHSTEIHLSRKATTIFCPHALLSKKIHINISRKKQALGDSPELGPLRYPTAAGRPAAAVDHCFARRMLSASRPLSPIPSHTPSLLF